MRPLGSSPPLVSPVSICRKCCRRFLLRCNGFSLNYQFVVNAPALLPLVSCLFSGLYLGFCSRLRPVLFAGNTSIPLQDKSLHHGNKSPGLRSLFCAWYCLCKQRKCTGISILGAAPSYPATGQAINSHCRPSAVFNPSAQAARIAL